MHAVLCVLDFNNPSYTMFVCITIPSCDSCTGPSAVTTNDQDARSPTARASTHPGHSSRTADRYGVALVDHLPRGWVEQILFCFPCNAVLPSGERIVLAHAGKDLASKAEDEPRDADVC